MINNFDYAFEETLGLEGGYSDDPDDRGGVTNYGITQATLEDVLRRFVISGITHVSQLTPVLAKAIYKTDYWNKIQLYQVNNVYVAAEIFDTAVNMGRKAAIIIVQKALNYLGENLIEDGIIGPRTIKALNRWAKKDERALLVTLNGFQFKRYVEIVKNKASQQKFGRGWTKRVSLYQKKKGE